MRFFSIFVFLLLASLAKSQDTTKSYLYLANGKILGGDSVFWDDSQVFNFYPEIVCKGKLISQDSILFINSKAGFEANGIKLRGSSFFFERVSKGKINLYNRPMLILSNYKYWNTGYNDLKKVKLGELIYECRDNQRAVSMLKKARVINNIGKSFYFVLAPLIVLGGIGLEIYDPHGGSYVAAGCNVAFFTGFGGRWIRAFNMVNIKKGVDIYNE